MLVAHDRLCVNADNNSSLSMNVEKLCDLQWQMVDLPDDYMVANWPLRHAVIDAAGQNVAVAGKNGSLFGSEMHDGFLIFFLFFWLRLSP